MPTLSRSASLAGLLGTMACNGLFYHPSPERFATPAALGIAFDDVRIPSTGGVLLSAWRLRSEGPPKGAVIHFHGNAENMSSHFRFVAWLTRAGYQVLTFDYRGYGASTGEPSREGLVEDGVAVLDFAARDPELGALDRFILAQSLGGAVAIPAFVRADPAAAAGVRAVIVESTFASYRGLAWAKVRSSPLLWLAAPAVLSISTDLDPGDDVERLGRPLLVIHGDADPVVPFGQGEALFEAAREPRELWRVAGGRHTPAFGSEGSPWRARLLAYLEAHAHQ